jgi:hypothetical protein
MKSVDDTISSEVLGSHGNIRGLTIGLPILSRQKRLWQELFTRQRGVDTRQIKLPLRSSLIEVNAKPGRRVKSQPLWAYNFVSSISAPILQGKRNILKTTSRAKSSTSNEIDEAKGRIEKK